MKKVFLRKDNEVKVVFDKKNLTKKIKGIFIYPQNSIKLGKKQFDYQINEYKKDKNYTDISLEEFIRNLFKR